MNEVDKRLTHVTRIQNTVAYNQPPENKLKAFSKLRYRRLKTGYDVREREMAVLAGS